MPVVEMAPAYPRWKGQGIRTYTVGSVPPPVLKTLWYHSAASQLVSHSSPWGARDNSRVGRLPVTVWSKELLFRHLDGQQAAAAKEQRADVADTEQTLGPAVQARACAQTPEQEVDEDLGHSPGRSASRTHC